jgi:hypothetical protein
VLERRQFRRPERRQQLAPDQRQRELDLLEPEAGTPTRFQRPWASTRQSRTGHPPGPLGRAECERARKIRPRRRSAREETGKPDPDKGKVAGALERIVKYAKEADDFDTHASNLLPHVAALGSWLGTAGYALLKAHGIAP